MMSYARTGDSKVAVQEAGYSASVQAWMGDKLLAREDVRAQLKELEDKVESVKDDVPIQEVIKGFRVIADANILDFYDESGQVVDVMRMDREKAKAIKEIKRTVNPKNGHVTVTVTMHDKVAALQNLGRIGGHYAADNGQTSGDVNIQINLPGGLGKI